MRKDIERFLIMPDDYGKNDVKRAFYKAVDLSKKLNGNIVLMLPTKSNLEDSLLLEVLEKNKIKKLKKENECDLYDGIRLRLITEVFSGELRNGEILLLLHPTRKFLEKVNDWRNISAVVVLSWIMEEVEEWKILWDPFIIGKNGNVYKEGKEIKLDCIVKKMMEGLLQSINMNTGFGHSCDRKKAIEFLSILYKNNIPFDPTYLKLWAMKEGLKSKYARELEEMANKILEGRKLRTNCGPLINIDVIPDKIIEECEKE